MRWRALCCAGVAGGTLAMMLAAAALGGAAAEPFGLSRGQPEVGGFAGWILAEQAAFYRTLSGAIRAAKADGSAAYALLGISFLYGIFHAAGPGHGKAVISSYLVANRETWRRGIVLSFASAALQSLTAILVVAVAAALLGATAKMMGDAVRVIETLSYGLIIVIGARLSWTKGRAFIALWRIEADQHRHDRHGAEDHEDHDHDSHASDILPWGHAHPPEPRALAGPGGWTRGLSAAFAVGLRPCSGAIIVLVFALAQGLFWIGVVSTFMMGLGTAITVAAIATAAVAARGMAGRLAEAKPGLGLLALRGLEIAAATLVMLFGFLLLVGYIASERLGI
jgi:nickel/cobalt transporter (NicO) family protein